MGLIQGTFTFLFGYLVIEFIRKHKDKLKDVPIISDYVDITEENKDKISGDAYIVLMGFVLKDFLF